MARKTRDTLEKTLSLGDIWAVALGSIIGWACFVQGANWTAKAGGPGALLIGLLIGALLMIVVGYNYSYMISKFPVAGGEFAYAYKGFGKTASYICGWMLSLGYLTIVALNATALPLLASYIFPGVFNHGYMYTIAGYDVYAGEVALSCFFIVLFGIMNYRGTKSAGKLQFLMVVILCSAVLVALGGTVFTGNFNIANLTPAYGVDVPLIEGVIAIIALAPFLYVGFDCIPQAAEEYDFPPEKSKMLIISAIIVGGLVYAVMAMITAGVIPWTEVTSMTDSNGEVAKWFTGSIIEMSMGKIGVVFVATAVCMGIFTGMNGFYMSSSRLLFGMARANMLPKVFSKIHPKHNTPSACIIFVMIVSFICPFFGREVIAWVVDMCSVGTAFGYFFTCGCAYILLKKFGNPDDACKIKPSTAIFGCVIAIIALLLLITPGSPAFMATESFIALGAWIFIGVIFYFISRKGFMETSKREMDYLILGDVQVIRGLRKNLTHDGMVQGTIVQQVDKSNK